MPIPASKLRELPATIDVRIVSQILGCTTKTVYSECRPGGSLEDVHIRVGRHIRFVTERFLAKLGLEPAPYAHIER